MSERLAALALVVTCALLAGGCGGGSEGISSKGPGASSTSPTELTPEDRAIAACEKLVEARDADGPIQAAPLMNEAVRLAHSAAARDQQWNDVLQLMQGEKVLLDSGRPFPSFSRRTVLRRCSGLLADNQAAVPDEATPTPSSAKAPPCPSGDIRAQIGKPVTTEDGGDYRSEMSVVVENRTTEALDVQGVDVTLDTGQGGVLGFPATADSGKSLSWTSVIYTSNRPSVVEKIGWDFDWTDDEAFDACPIPDPIVAFA